MRTRPAVILAASAVALAGCGSAGGKSASLPAPPDPLVVSVLMSNARIVVSPGSFGAGPVQFTVVNAGSRAESLSIVRRGGGRVASTAPLNPQASTQLSVVLTRGSYTASTGAQGATDAQRSVPSNISPTTIRVGRERPSSGATLLQP